MTLKHNSTWRTVRLMIFTPIALLWPMCMIWLFYLGFSRNEWLDDLFFHWEGISFLLLPGFIFGGAIVGLDVMGILDDRVVPR